ncbi:Prp18-domain-containing protein [Martensiomyces pterosporus]|nr:Prp18-domain-containing protein [Martensiomyces pterosporus]
MDFLKAAISSEVEKRKKAYKRAASSSGNTKEAAEESGSRRKHRRYVRVADLEQAAEQDVTGAKDPEPSRKDKESDSTPPPSSAKGAGTEGAKPNTGLPDDGEKASVAGDKGEEGSEGANAISNDEAVKRLRARGEPIRLFGESDKQRRMRLRQLELSEEKTDGQANEFRRVLAQVEAGAMLEDLKRQAKMDDGEEEKRRKKYALLESYDTSDISMDLLRTDMDRLSTLLYVYFKRTLYEWEDYLATRPEAERRSAEGKMAAATQRQSADYLKPFFRSLKHRKFEADVMARITEIARNTLDREYMKANDAYLQLSIGNAPWPVGVTQVGIHARAARENIFANKVAHVLNDETQRKWIQSIKRLMRFAQTKYPPEDLAKMMG